VKRSFYEPQHRWTQEGSRTQEVPPGKIAKG